MITYVTPSALHLAGKTDHILEVSLFCDGAYDLNLPEEIQNCPVRLIHNNRNHDDWILLYLLVEKFADRHCLLHLILPYISYGRQTPEYLQTLFKPLNHPVIHHIATFDLHQDREGIINLSTAALLAADIKKRGLETAVLIAPDRGSIYRVERLATLTGQQVVGLEKVRSPDRVTITSSSSFYAEGQAIIVDDMIDTGSTLKACSQYLLGQGFTDVHVYATHGVLSYGIGKWAEDLASLTFVNTLPAVNGNDRVRWLDIRGELSHYAE
jgi:ribose-phosphate pyrophosphokinase